jgi:hypothetical protein
MEENLKQLLYQIELHSPEGIEHWFKKNLTTDSLHVRRPLVYELIGEYTRTPRFKDCIRVFLSHGFGFNDPILSAVLIDDSRLLKKLIRESPESIYNKYDLPCAYTPLLDCSLLHICAEFNHVSSAQILLEAGLSVDIKAGTDEYGFGAHTPLFHTVNQNSNASSDMMQLLLDSGASLSYTVSGLIWGKGYDWETFIPFVNPISYAMMGLLPQMHRDEATITRVVSTLISRNFGINYTPSNIPCRYLSK